MASGPMSIGTPSENLVPPPPPAEGVEPKHGGFTRFEIELEFVQSLANPQYLNHLASRKFLSEPAFVNYLAYLQYWTRPPYLKYLTYPGPTIKHLELLQDEKFRQDIISPELVNRLMEEGMRAGIEHHLKDAGNVESKMDEPANIIAGQLDGTLDEEANNTEGTSSSETLNVDHQQVSSDDDDSGSSCIECLANELGSIVGQVCSTCLNRKLGNLGVEESSSGEDEAVGHATPHGKEELASISPDTVEDC